MATKKVLVLARGLGTRMQKDAGGAALSPEARRLAEGGLKGLLPLNGRPFLDYLFGVIVQAGFERACLVVGPQAAPLRAYGEDVSRRSGLCVEFAVQNEPRGTGDAVAAGREFAGGDSFVMLNSDNWMAAEGLRALREARGAEEAAAADTSKSGVHKSPAGELPGMGESIGMRDTGYEEEFGGDDDDDVSEDTAFGVGADGGADAGFLLGFERAALLKGNIPPDRVGRFAVLETGGDGKLVRIVEKPADPERYARDGKLFVSMNCWQMPNSIFEACAAIKPSPRGELEITDAVQWLIDGGKAEFRVLPRSEPVYDLTGRDDIGAVERALAGYKIPFPATK